MKLQKACTLLLLVGLLSGCSAGVFTDRPSLLQLKDGVHTPQQTEVLVITNYHGSDQARLGMTKQEYRNSIIYQELAADDDSFHAFVSKIRSQRAATNIAADSALLVLNGVASVTGDAPAKAALAAASAGIVGIKGSVDKEFFNLETVSVLISRMKAARLTALVPIKAGLAEGIDAYPLEQGLVDLRDYSNAGTLVATLDAISNDAGTLSADAKSKIETITRGADYRDTTKSRNDLTTKLAKLTDAQVTALAFLMQTHLGARTAEFQADVLESDPASDRFKTAKSARIFLGYWLQQELSDAALKEWADAIETAEKG